VKKLIVLIVFLIAPLASAFKIPSAATDRYISFVAVDSTDLKTRETGLSGFAVYYYLDDGSATVMTTPTVTEPSSANMPGCYRLLIDESGMTTLSAGHDSEELILHITQASMSPVTRAIEIYRVKLSEGQTVTAAGNKISGVALVDSTTTVTGNVSGSVGSLGATAKADVNTEVDAALNTAIPGSPLAGSINERIKTLDDAYTVTRAGYLDNLIGHTPQTGDTYALASNGVYGFSALENLVDDIGVAGAGLTNIDLPNQTMDITGSLSGSVGSVTNDVTLVSDAITSAKIDDTAWDELIEELFSYDATLDYSTATVGSLVKEITDNASGSGTTPAAVWAYATRILTANTNFNDPTAAVIADAIWDEDIVAAHNTADTAGALLDTPADWATATSVTVSDKTGFSLAIDQSAVTIGTVTTATNAEADIAALNNFDPAADTVNLSAATETQIDSIEMDTSAYDSDAEYATAIWNAATASYGSAGSYGELVEAVKARWDALTTTGGYLEVDLKNLDGTAVKSTSGNIHALPGSL